MANLDTRSKRASSVAVFASWQVSPVLPDGTISRLDRQHVAWTYSGISAGAAVAVVATGVGYDYKVPRSRRHRLYIDGKLHMVTPEEEAALLNKLIADLDSEIERATKKVAALPPKVASLASKRVAKVEVKRDDQKLYRALLDDQSKARQSQAKQIVEMRKRAQRMRAHARTLEDDEDIIKLLAHF